MTEKTYDINGDIFKLKDYGDLTGHDEDIINQLLKSGDNNSLIIKNTDFLPVILTCDNKEIDLNKYDWNQVKNKILSEIIIDFMTEKKIFMISMGIKLRASLMQSQKQSEDTKENTGNHYSISAIE